MSQSVDQLMVSRFGCCPKAGAGVHQWQNKAVCSLLAQGYSDEDTYRVVKRLTASCGRNTDQDIWESIRTAKLNMELGGGGAVRNDSNTVKRRAIRIREEFEPDIAEAFAKRIPAVSFKNVKICSPIPVSGTPPGEFLSYLYYPGERVLIFKNPYSQGHLWRPGDSLREFVGGGGAGVFFLSNPVDGLWRHYPEKISPWNPNGRSRRTRDSIIDWRYLVLECDLKPKEKWLPLWLRILLQLPLPIVSIVSSGDRSLHALVRVNRQTKEDWDALRDDLRPRLVRLGTDPDVMTGVRLTRLANCYRGKRLQELLYLDPEADCTGIYRKLLVAA